MNESDDPQNKRAEPTKKLPWQPPTLTRLGSVLELTQGNPSGAAADRRGGSQ